MKDNISTAFDLTGKGVADFVQGIKDKAGGSKISVLRIWSHGVTHYSDGGQYDRGGNFLLGGEKVGPDTIENYAAGLSALTTIFERGARVELRGCQVAFGTGKDMMIRLAEIWKVEVQGGERSQPMMSWVPPIFSAKPGAKSLQKAMIIDYNEKAAHMSP